VASYFFQGAAESIQNTGEPIDDLDNAFRPSTQLLTMGGERAKKTGPSMEGDGELIDHDEAHRVFRSPRPSITLQELQELHELDKLRELRERESRKHSGDGASGQGTTGHSAMRGGIFGGAPLDDLWLAQGQDVGADLGEDFYAGSAALDAEAHKAWDEAAREEYQETAWWDACVFSDSEAEDVTSGDSGCML